MLRIIWSFLILVAAAEAVQSIIGTDFPPAIAGLTMAFAWAFFPFEKFRPEIYTIWVLSVLSLSTYGAWTELEFGPWALLIPISAFWIGKARAKRLQVHQ